jgi:predicted dithiol-disulfide oxidoreductase (DUF899 family)
MAPVIVNREEWTKARVVLLEKEKSFTRSRDQLSQQRRELPWTPVTKEYVFEGPEKGQKQTLSQLFGDKSQLVVYHLMFGPNADAPCTLCSFWADNFNGIDVHLAHRDVSFVAISRAPLEKLQAFEKRMGWTFPWVSAAGNDFPVDMHVAFTPEQVASTAEYNYKQMQVPGEDMPGASVFAKDEKGMVYHTYSCYERGLDILNGAYNWLDLTPKGRNEKSSGTAWVRRHDEYGD